MSRYSANTVVAKASVWIVLDPRPDREVLQCRLLQRKPQHYASGDRRPPNHRREGAEPNRI